jgi:hypothetical protein
LDAIGMRRIALKVGQSPPNNRVNWSARNEFLKVPRVPLARPVTRGVKQQHRRHFMILRAGGRSGRRRAIASVAYSWGTPGDASGGHHFPTDREVVTKIVEAINRFIR